MSCYSDRAFSSFQQLYLILLDLASLAPTKADAELIYPLLVLYNETLGKLARTPAERAAVNLAAQVLAQWRH